MFCKIFTYTLILRLLVMENSMWVGHPEIIPMSKISIDTGRVITEAPKQLFRDDMPNALQHEQQLQDNRVFGAYEQPPTFPGGTKALFSFIRTNLKMPAKAKKAGISGRVFVAFTVEDTGEIKYVNIVKGLGFGCDQEAVRLINSMPNWKPGTISGKPVRVRFNLPISFIFED